MTKNEKMIKLVKKMLMIFLLIQPILDLAFFYDDKIMSVFKLSPSTIIRFMMIIIMFVITYFSKKHGKQEKILYIYFTTLIIYFLVHHFNSLGFDYNFVHSFNYSFITELFYFIRMIMPILLIYVVVNAELNRNDIKRIVMSIVLSYSIVIILSSIFKFGIASYGGGKLVYSIIDWFKHDNILISEFASQGLFEGANRLGVLLSALFPIVNFFYFYEKNNKNIVVILLQILSLLIIGTKVSTYTWIIVSIIIIILYIIFSILKIKIKYNFKKLFLYLLVIGFCLFLVSKSPVLTSTQYDDDYNLALLEEENSNYYKMIKDVKKLDEKEKIIALENIIKNDTGYLWINKIYFTNLYNYRIDPDFWLDYMLEPFEKRHNDRNTQQEIIKRIINKNDNKLDLYFGIGYSRFRNSDIYLERDYLMHVSSLGLVGTLLLIGPYVIILVYAGINILKNIKRQFRFELLVYCCSLSIFVLTSMICGHVVDEMITYIFIALMCGKIFEQIHYPKKILNKNKAETKVSVIVPVYNVEEYLEECLESILNQDVKELEVILVNDASTDKSLSICEKYVKNHGFILINNEKNSGPAISRNKGIEKATGEYIVFVDSDDILYNDNISTLYNVAKKEKADIVISKLNSFNRKGEFGYYSDKYIKDYKIGTIYDNKNLINCISICSKIYKTSLIKNIKFLENTYHEDNSFSLTAFFKASNIAIVPKYLYYRRVRDGENKSIMQTLNYDKYLDLIKNYEEVLKNIDLEKNNYFLYRYMCRQLSNYILKNVPLNKRKDAFNDAIEFITRLNKKSLIIYMKIYYNAVKYPYIAYKKIRK